MVIAWSSRRKEVSTQKDILSVCEYTMKLTKLTELDVIITNEMVDLGYIVWFWATHDCITNILYIALVILTKSEGWKNQSHMTYTDGRCGLVIPRTCNYFRDPWNLPWQVLDPLFSVGTYQFSNITFSQWWDSPKFSNITFLQKFQKCLLDSSK